MEGFKRILVVSRSTKECREAARVGISLTRRYGAEIFILHAVHDPFGLKGWNLPIASRTVLEKEHNRILEEAKADLDRIVQSEKAAGIDVKELVVEEKLTDAVLETVARERIDLIVMPAHEQGRLEHFLLGQDNEEIIRRMPCSVLLVRKEW